MLCFRYIQSDSVIYVHIFFFGFFLHIDYYKYWIEFSVLYSRFCTCSIYCSVCENPKLLVYCIIKKSTNNNCWRGWGEESRHECKLVQPVWRTVWRFLKKLKRELPYDIMMLLLSIYLEKTIIQKDTCNVHCSMIYNNQDMEAT